MAQYYRKLSKGIRFFYKFDLDGKTYYSKCIYLSKREAQGAERERYKLLDEERRFGKQDKPLLLDDMIKERVKFLTVKYSQSHKINSEHYLDLFAESIGNSDIRDISRKDVEDFLLDYSKRLNGNKIDNYQVNAALKTIKAMFNYVIESYDLPIKNPCKSIKPYSVNKKLKYIPPDEDIEKVLGLVNKRQKLLIRFIMETGCRINEALNLEFGDIKDSYLVFYTRKSRNSNRVPRKVPIPECIKGLTGRGKVFPEWTEQPKFLDHVLRDKKMKVWGWHCLRHRYASLLSKQGKPLFEIMSLLGHCSITTTQIYLQMLS
ncbi:MAG: tyrosine-type recombinase/integrase [Ignavibacteriaceae bacterium]|nr:tyrosine-type recombinase/integrase [Ignavibacteriaceae bacterium]